MKSGKFFVVITGVFALFLCSCEDFEVAGYSLFKSHEYYEKDEVNDRDRDLEDQIADLKAQLDALTGGSAIDLASLEARVTQNEVDVAANAVGIGTNATDIAAHNTRISQNETKLASVSVGNDSSGFSSVFFSGVNVYIQSGTGATDGDTTGVGNLIVGYNENLLGFSRTGSHNIVVSKNHGYSSYGGLVAGQRNRILAPSASVIGGYRNTASGEESSVSGGYFNMASNLWSSVSGGYANMASGGGSSVSGGESNTASGFYSSVSGGISNTASATYSSVSGGGYNRANLEGSSVSGGSGRWSTAVLFPCGIDYNWMAGITAFSCP